MEMGNGKRIDAKLYVKLSVQHAMNIFYNPKKSVIDFYNPKKSVILLFFGYIWPQMEMEM